MHGLYGTDPAQIFIQRGVYLQQYNYAVVCRLWDDKIKEVELIEIQMRHRISALLFRYVESFVRYLD